MAGNIIDGLIKFSGKVDDILKGGLQMSRAANVDDILNAMKSSQKTIGQLVDGLAIRRADDTLEILDYSRRLSDDLIKELYPGLKIPEDGVLFYLKDVGIIKATAKGDNALDTLKGAKTFDEIVPKSALQNLATNPQRVIDDLTEQLSKKGITFESIKSKAIVGVAVAGVGYLLYSFTQWLMKRNFKGDILKIERVANDEFELTIKSNIAMNLLGLDSIDKLSVSPITTTDTAYLSCLSGNHSIISHSGKSRTGTAKIRVNVGQCPNVPSEQQKVKSIWCESNCGTVTLATAGFLTNFFYDAAGLAGGLLGGAPRASGDSNSNNMMLFSFIGCCCLTLLLVAGFIMFMKFKEQP